jgi:Holliday junction resolvasome RuvABC endonuclease subunit
MPGAVLHENFRRRSRTATLWLWVIEALGQELHYVASGTIKTTHLDKGDLPKELEPIFEGVCEVR